MPLPVPYSQNNEENNEFLLWYPDGESFCYVNDSSVKKYVRSAILDFSESAVHLLASQRQSMNGTGKPVAEGPLVNGDAETGSSSRIVSDVAIVADNEIGSPRLLISSSTTITIKSTSSVRASKSAEHHELIGEFKLFSERICYQKLLTSKRR